MHLKKFLNAIEQIAPIQLAESWDNVGLLVESPIPRQNATATFLCIDLTPSVLSEALKNPKVGIICAYHPPLFSSIKRLDLKSQSVILNCIANGISIYSPHTSLDSTRNGINDWLSRLIGKGTVKPIIPNTTNAEIGAGRILTLSKPVLLSELIDRVKIGLNLNHVRVAGTLETSISTVAICAGSGTGLLKGVVADLWITGEMGHHDVLSGLKQGTCVILTEHSNSERGYLKDVLVDLLKAQGVEDVVVSAQDQDPLRVC